MANQIARRLRKMMTPQEVKVWNHLRSWRQKGFHFRRQAPRAGYIVDFVCLKYRIVVELDGGQHNLEAHQASDDERDKALVDRGFLVLTGVLETIHATLVGRTPHPAVFGGHPPPSGEG
jgi:very-short-patch-repair endonuclease